MWGGSIFDCFLLFKKHFFYLCDVYPATSVQHALAMVGGVITVPLLVAGGFDANL